MSQARDVADLMHQAIREGEFDGVDGRLPRHEELAERYGCSRTTVQRAVMLLREENVLYTNHAGTFVGARPDPVTGKSAWRLRCHMCRNVFHAPGVSVLRLRGLMREQGWVCRGSIRGFDYFCPDHVPWAGPDAR